MDKANLFRELTDSTATMLFLEGFFEIGETVLVGKNEVQDYYPMATSFFEAATELKKIVLANLSLHLFRYEYPMFFLYRHSLELYIKSVLPKPRKGHNIEQLLCDFIKYCKDVLQVDISNGWFVQAMKEFSQIDPYAQSFRYPKNLSGNPTLAGDYIVNVKNWGETMDKIATVFLHLHVFQEGQNKNKAGIRDQKSRSVLQT